MLITRSDPVHTALACCPRVQSPSSGHLPTHNAPAAVQAFPNSTPPPPRSKCPPQSRRPHDRACMNA